MIVTIKGKKYTFEFDSVWGPLYMYEEVCGETLPFDARKTICMHVLWWCILARANKDFTLRLDDFLQALNDLKLVNELRRYYSERMEILGAGANDSKEESESEDRKKKD